MDSEKIVALASQIHQTMTHKQKTLALAESCTGGYVSHIFTQISGVSKWFLGSLVTYCDAFKERFLQVSTSSLAEHGAVSQQVVSEMVQGVLSLTEADFAIAFSGIAGPDGGSKEKPVGTIWIGIGERKGNIKTFCLHLSGTRLQIIQQATFEALNIFFTEVV